MDEVKNWDLITNNPMNVMILTGLIVTGIFIKLFLGTNVNSATNGKASSTIWGYGLASISLFTLMFVVLSSDLNKEMKPLTLLLNRGLPIFTLVLILIYIIVINLNYFDKINLGYIPTEYNTYSVISSILIVFQIGIIYQFSSMLLKKSDNKNLSKFDNMVSKIINITWVFSALNLLVAVIMNIILKYFTTDG